MQRAARIEEIAGDIVRYRRDGIRLTSSPPGWGIASEEEAEAIQDRVAEIIGEPVVGWKVGAPDPSGQRRLGLSRPFTGRVFGPFLGASPAVLSRRLLPTCMVESEIAFSLAVGLPPRKLPYGLPEVKAAIAACYPAFEVIDFSWPSKAGLNSLDFVADNGACGGLVAGTAYPHWREHETTGVVVELDIEGQQVALGTITKSIHQLLDVVVWLANDLSRRAIGLKAGQLIVTGSWTGMHPLAAGQRARARFGPIGNVEARLPKSCS